MADAFTAGETIASGYSLSVGRQIGGSGTSSDVKDTCAVIWFLYS